MVKIDLKCPWCNEAKLELAMRVLVKDIIIYCPKCKKGNIYAHEKHVEDFEL
jgi:hypothetical protein